MYPASFVWYFFGCVAWKQQIDVFFFIYSIFICGNSVVQSATPLPRICVESVKCDGFIEAIVLDCGNKARCGLGVQNLAQMVNG